MTRDTGHMTLFCSIIKMRKETWYSEGNRMTTEKLLEMLPLFIPLLAVQVGVQVYCMINLIKRKKVRFNNKWIWGIIILGFQILGCALYLGFRGEEDAGDQG